MPLSKSESNRALIISALTPGAKLPADVAACADTEVMKACLAGMESGAVNVGAAGTTMRFLTAYAAATPGMDVVIDGNERMRERPIGPLVDALLACGADVEYVGPYGFPPLRVRGRKLKGGEVTVDASVSSQFISALMMVAPLMDEGLRMQLTGDIASSSYIRLTARMMMEAGVEVEIERDSVTVSHGAYAPVDWRIGGDWSSASYWYELEALSSGFVTLEGLDADSAQPDRRVAEIFSLLSVDTQWEGEEGGIDLLASPELSPRLTVDMTDTPDLAQTVIVTCVMAGIPFNITGLETLRIKETDRVAALETELLKLGVVADTTVAGAMAWDGVRRPIAEVPVFDTYSDHRMALSLAPVSLYLPGIVIRDVEVVEKSYPEFWEQLREAGFLVADASLPPEEMQRLYEEHMAAQDFDDEDDD